MAPSTRPKKLSFLGASQSSPGNPLSLCLALTLGHNIGFHQIAGWFQGLGNARFGSRQFSLSQTHVLHGLTYRKSFLCLQRQGQMLTQGCLDDGGCLFQQDWEC